LLISSRQYDSVTFPFRSKPRALAAAAAVAGLAAGLAVWLASRDGGSANARPKDDPVVFLSGIVRAVAANDYERVWPTLHPAQQRIATRPLYVRCEQLSPVAGHLDSLKVVRAVNRRISVAGAGEDLVDSKAVTFEVTLSEGSTGASVVVRQTAHAVAVDGRWRWILSPRRFATYRSGDCPTDAPPPTPSA
jgi:hypothetical protein